MKIAAPVPEFVVHNFTSSSTLGPSSASLLGIGRSAILKASNRDGWINIGLKEQLGNELLFAVNYSNVYGYTVSLPVIDFAPYTIRQGLKSWGEEADEEECFDLKGLLGFESLSLDFTNPGPATLATSGVVVEDIEPCRLKKLIALEAGSNPVPLSHTHLSATFLHNIIPQPQFIPGIRRFDIPSETGRPEDQKSNPTPIPPHTIETVTRYLTDDDRRGSWLIPIRGIVPWESCTAAGVLVSGANPFGPSTAPETGGRGCILWTEASVLALWEYLLAVHKEFDRVTLSFHASKTPCSTGYFKSLSNPSKGQVNSINGVLHNAAGSSPFCRSSLNANDYLKVYHNVMDAMRIRSLLDAFTFHSSDISHQNTGESNGIPETRPLEGAKLAFLDEQSKGIFFI